MKRAAITDSLSEKALKIKKKFFLKKACGFKNKLYFCSRFEKQTPRGSVIKVIKTEEYVHRHIGLTA